MSKIAKSKLDLIVDKSFQREPFYASKIAEKNAQLNTKECLKRLLVTKSKPARVRLELTNACNLNCVFCYRSHFRTEDRRVLTPDDIDILSPILKTAKFISLSQKAEPLMSPYIIPILDKMTDYNSIFSLYTNGQLLNESISLALIRNKINFLTISISAFNDNYQRFHRGGRWDKLIENIKTLNSLKEKYNSKHPRLRLSFILRTDTIDYLDDALNFVKKYYFSEGIQMLLFFRWTDSDKKKELIFNWNKYKPIINAFKERAKNNGVLIDLASDVPEKMRPSLTKKYIKLCYEPWESFNITPGGDVIPCGQSEVITGNIHSEDPIAIWNNYNYHEFRSRMNNKPFNEDCTKCWHCRYVSPLIQGNNLVKLDKIFDSFYRI